MNTFTASSLVAASMLLAACGSAGSVDTPMTSGPLDDHPLNRIDTGLTPPKPTGPVTPDTIIPSPATIGRFDEVTAVNITCRFLSCNTEYKAFSSDISTDFYSPDETAFNRNGRVNGPNRRTFNNNDYAYTAYDYWMGDSMFSVTHGKS